MIKVTDNIFIAEHEIKESFIRSSGPGGQNVNKVSTAVQLKFNVVNSPSLPEEVKFRLIEIAGSRISKDGSIVITANNFRTQNQNRDSARSRLLDLIHKATITQLKRYPTRLPYSVKQERIDSKVKRGQVKKLRSKLESGDE